MGDTHKKHPPIEEVRFLKNPAKVKLQCSKIRPYGETGVTENKGTRNIICNMKTMCLTLSE
jgi:hypothetical protein